MRWVVDTTLNKTYPAAIDEACKKLGLEYVPMQVIPFMGEIPEIDTDKPTLFYGNIGWINNIRKSNKWKPGVFGPMLNYRDWAYKYGEYTLNSEARYTTLAEVVKDTNLDPDEDYFIRPTADNKAFPGEVIRIKKLIQWIDTLYTHGLDLYKEEIMINYAFFLSCEWRLFMVDQKVCSGSQYRIQHRFSKSDKVPERVTEFAERMAQRYSPSEVYVMDVCECNQVLYVLELGGFHSAGFYSADIEKIVHDVSFRRTND